MDGLRSKIQSFKYIENKAENKVPVNLKRVQKPIKKKPKEVPKESPNRPDLPPSIGHEQIIMFVGYNPGVESSIQQHHYAHFSNLFWKLFNHSKLFLKILQVQEYKSDKLLETLAHGNSTFLKPEHDYELVKYRIGFTDLVLRCTKTAQELSMEEKLANVPRLLEEFTKTNTKYVVFIGKGIWEIIVKFIVKQIGVTRFKLTKTNFIWGKQSSMEGSSEEIRVYNLILSRLHEKLPSHTKVYVFPNTSGLVASLKFDEKLQHWLDLADDIISDK